MDEGVDAARPRRDRMRERAVRLARWGRKVAAAIGHGTVMFAMALGQLPITVVVMVGVVLTYSLGMVFFFPPAIRLGRWWTGIARRRAEAWSGVRIEDPYQPPPPPPVRQADGWYREGRTLYRTPRFPAWNRRLNWLTKDPATWRDLAWLVLHPITGAPLAVLPLLLIGYGAYLAAAQPWPGALAGAVPAVAGLLAAPYVPRLYGLWTRALLGPTERTRLARQISHLARTRTEAVDAQAAELRRIERDLHDGAQARLVAMGMTLGAAERLVDTDPATAKELIAKTREASAEVLAELRRLVRGIYPPVLAERGLGDAVRALALDCPLKATVEVDLPDRPPPPVEAAAYFAVSELLTNAARHSRAREVTVGIGRRGGDLRITVTDDGVGGADPARGSGLRGLERRIAAFDGELALHSPPGGPTVAVIELPGVLPVRDRPRATLPRRKIVLMAVCMGFSWLPLFAQGLVALVMKLVGAPRGWFVALYLPDPFSWLALIAFINLGLMMLVYGSYLAVEYEHSKRLAASA
ncbi:MAG: histidine kinase [Actinomycetes bacterium]|jgi:signal transduction histidine kinase